VTSGKALRATLKFISNARDEMGSLGALREFLAACRVAINSVFLRA